MLVKTHIALSIFFALILWNFITGKVTFLALLLIATLIPDIDASGSYINRKISPLNKIFNFLTKHRGFLHSMTFCLCMTLIITLFSTKSALPFFLGYSSHLLADSFTVTGIRAFWPSNKTVKWIIPTGGLTERVIFCLLVIIDIVLLLSVYFPK